MHLRLLPNRVPRGWAAMLAALVLFTALPFGAAARTQADAAGVGPYPWVHQWYSLTCEYAAVASVTWYYGELVSQRVFINEVPSNPNPHLGFRGRINGPVGGLSDYGVYAEALVPVLQNHGYQAQAVYADTDWLKGQIAAGHPVVVWMTYQARWSTRSYFAADDGTRYSLVPWEHCVVVTAYNNYGVTIMDPYSGTFQRFGWDAFEHAWSYFDHMALLITPNW